MRNIETTNRAVPWSGLDVLLFLFIWVMAQIIAGIVAGILAYIASVFEPSKRGVDVDEQTQSVTITMDNNDHDDNDHDNKNHGHPVEQLIKQNKYSPIFLLIAFLAIVVAAPLVEELLFRLFLQGWLEVLLTQLQTPFARGFAIVAVSILFAFAHAGSTGVINERVLLYLFVTMTIANLMVFALGIIYLSYVRNVQVIRCFFGTKPFLRPEFPVIVVLCLAALVPIYGLSYGLDLYYPDVNTDPIPIFLFSLLLGALYSFTRNLSYCILLHAVLNVTSLTILWFTV